MSNQIKLTDKVIKANERKTLNNILCMINEEVKVVKLSNEKINNVATTNIQVHENNKKDSIQNIKNLTLSYSNIRG